VTVRPLYPLLHLAQVQVFGGPHDGTTYPMEEIARLQIGGFVKLFDPVVAVAAYKAAAEPYAPLAGVSTYELKLERICPMAEVRPILALAP
jgi:hypothetical protein